MVVQPPLRDQTSSKTMIAAGQYRVYLGTQALHLPEKFLVASMVVRMAPCNRQEGPAGVGGRGEAEKRRSVRKGRQCSPQKQRQILCLSLHLSPTSPGISLPGEVAFGWHSSWDKAIPGADINRS